MFHLEKFAKRYTEKEQQLLREALIKIAREQKQNNEETRALFTFNAVPFIGFGFLDNMIMILAGEYIDQQLGTLLCLSTMAAAAIGNIVSDVAGVGLAHYVEARWTTNAARAFGLTLGCIIGMFPLLLFDDEEKSPSEETKS